jgi:hypothetical protein
MTGSWDETPKATSFTVVIPSDVDVSKDDVESAVESVIEGENDVEECTDDGTRRFERGYEC